MIVTNEWIAEQVDHANTFFQASMLKAGHINLPERFRGVEKITRALRLMKCVHDLKKAPKTFFH